MNETDTVSVQEVQATVRAAIAAVQDILIKRSELTEDQSRLAQAQLAGAHLVFSEFLQAPQIALPDPSLIFGLGGDDAEEDGPGADILALEPVQ